MDRIPASRRTPSPARVRALALLCCAAICWVGPGARAWAAQKVDDPAGQLAREKARGKAYLDKAAHEKGAVRTASGMVFIPLREGTGPSPAKSSVVRINQTARLIDGKVFDASPPGKPLLALVPLVIPCWREGLQRMKVGGKARLVCPPELAFGDQAAARVFPGGSTMVYDLELLDVVKQ